MDVLNLAEIALVLKVDKICVTSELTHHADISPGLKC